MKTELIRLYVLALSVVVLTACGGGGGSSGDQASGDTVVHTLSYSANGADSGSAPISASYAENDTVTVLGNTGNLARNDGYNFIGWNTAGDGSGFSYLPGDTFSMGAADVTLYARWTSNPVYSVTYDANGATSGSVPAGFVYEEGSTVTVATNSGNLARSGYTFDGWNTAADGSGDGYTGGNTVSVGTADVTLYAQWTLIPTYTVTYNANGAPYGSVPASASYEEGDEVTVAGRGSLAWSGYTFDGWNTAANGSGTSYAANTTITIGTANVTLYAQWTLIPIYTVTYDANGAPSGSVPVPPIGYVQGDTVPVEGSGSLGWSGYSFEGWNTAANGSGYFYMPGDTFTMGTADVTLYAVWLSIPTFTVTYDGNGVTGGTVPVDPNIYQAEQVVSVIFDTAYDIYRTGYHFMGWNTRADGTGITYKPGNVFRGYADITLYAKWVPEAAEVSEIMYVDFLFADGIVPVGPLYYEKGTYAIALENTGGLSRAGYSFAGWSTEYEDGAADVVYKPGDLIPVNSTTTGNLLFPHWTTNTTYTVTYDGNGNDGGTVPVDTMHYEVGEDARIHGNTGNLVKAGYKFKGWNTQANGSGTLYNQPQTMNIPANVTLYAQWTNNTTYKVFYNDWNANTGVPPVDTANYEDGQEFTVFGNVGGMVNTSGSNTRLTGWNYITGTPQPGDTLVIDTSVYPFDPVLDAVWGAPLPTIMFEAGMSNGNLGGRSGATAICQSLAPPSCNGHSKIGPFLNAEDSSTVVDSTIAWHAGINIYAPVTGLDGTQISPDWDGLFIGIIENSLQDAGVLPPNTTWWSGMYSSAPGSIVGEQSCHLYQNWSSSSGVATGRVGSSSNTSYDWLGNSSQYAICGSDHFIVCTCSE